MLKLMKYFKPYLWMVLALLISVGIQATANLTVPNLMADMINKGVATGSVSKVTDIGIQMIGVVLIGSVAAIVSSFLGSILASSYSRDLRRDVFKKVESYSAYELNQLNTASLITRSTNDIQQLQQVWTMIFRMSLLAPIMAIGGFINAMAKSSKMGLVFGIAIPTLAIVFVVVSVIAIPLFILSQKRLDKLNLVMREHLTGVRVIRAYNRDDYESEKFDEVNKELVDVNVKVNRLGATTMPLFTMILNVTLMAIIWIGANQVQNMTLNVGDIAALIQYAVQVLFSFIMVAVIFVMVPRASASATRINEVLDLRPSIQDPKSPNTNFTSAGTLEFKNVTFRYPGAEEPVLEHISFVSSPGEVTAVIGGTGSGKSTLVQLIPRFYDIEDGSILIDGVDVREIPLEVLRKKIGFIPQKAVLFSGTIADNLRFGKEDATDEEMMEALRIAQSENFVLEKEDGLNSEVSQGGKNFSGGQKQRLSIARALVRKPEIYVFDDSFSALDFKTDAALRAALKSKIKDATMLVVAQRVSSIIDADRIIVLDQGEMVGIGTHQELLANCQIYKEIVESQLSEEEIKHESR